MSRKFAILGYPLKHTMSPPIHQRLFELAGLDADYSVIEASPEELKNHKEYLKSLQGFNVTIPHKVKIIPYLDKLDASAVRYGAVNCVSHEEGQTTGFNTDCYGFLRSLEIGGASLKGKVLQLGCGGVGRMMAIETALHGGELTIAVREGYEHETESVLNEIKSCAPQAVVHLTTLEKLNGQGVDGDFDLLINSTPVGMYPHTDGCPVSDSILEKCACVFEAIYNPIRTLLMQKAEGFGKKTIGGMAMLVWQAVVAHEIWDHSSYKNEDIAQLIRDMEKQVEEDFK